jgi:hypothetical protein
MIFKIFLSVFGEFTSYSNLKSEVLGDFLIFDDGHGESFDSISFWHPRKFSTNEGILAYEGWYIDFLLKNYKTFMRHGAKNFEFYYELYYTGEQCNFEIMNSSLLERISSIPTSFPVSVYLLSDEKYTEWETEINALNTAGTPSAEE